MTFIDYSKAFDSTSHKGESLEQQGIPSNYIAVIKTTTQIAKSEYSLKLWVISLR